MPDISMCADHTCPLNQRCYRYRAKPCEFRQSYMAFGDQRDGENCTHYWPTAGIDPARLTPHNPQPKTVKGNFRIGGAAQRFG